jgi:hypothetical protein
LIDGVDEQVGEQRVARVGEVHAVEAEQAAELVNAELLAADGEPSLAGDRHRVVAGCLAGARCDFSLGIAARAAERGRRDDER